MIILIGLASAFFLYGVAPYIWFLMYKPFNRVQLKGLSCDVRVGKQTNRYSYTDIFVIEVMYHYVIEGQSYSSSKVAFSDGLTFTNMSKAEELSKSLESQPHCFVSSKNPNKAFLLRAFGVGPSNSRHAALAASLLLVLTVLFLRFGLQIELYGF